MIGHLAMINISKEVVYFINPQLMCNSVAPINECRVICHISYYKMFVSQLCPDGIIHYIKKYIFECSIITSVIIIFRYMFDQSQKEAEDLKSIKKNDVISWYKTYLQQWSPKCRRLAVRVWGCNTNIKESEKHSKSALVIEDLTAFKLSSEFYQSLC